MQPSVIIADKFIDPITSLIHLLEFTGVNIHMPIEIYTSANPLHRKISELCLVVSLTISFQILLAQI